MRAGLLQSPLARWALLAAVTAIAVGAAMLLHLPAPALLGSIAAAMLAGRGLKLPRVAFLAAQAVIGCMIGQTMSADLFSAFLARWPLVGSVVLLTVGLSVSMGWVLYRLRLVDKATALWSSLPGAASAMVALSAEFGARLGLVAYIQYFRVLSVAVVATLAGTALADPAVAILGGHAGAAVSPTGAVLCLAIGAVLTWLSLTYRVIGLALIGSMVAVGLLQIFGPVVLWMPAPLLVIAYCLIGWQVGLALDRQTMQMAARLFVPVLLSTAVLLVLCGGVAVVLSRLFGVDLQTAFLATIPGGLDSVAIVAASTGADVAFVMLFQSVRFLVVVLLGIPVLYWLLRRQRSQLTGPAQT